MQHIFPLVIQVAIKMLKNTGAGLKEAFIEEARHMCSFEHWNLVEIVAVCFSSEPYMLATKFIDGMPLSEYMLYLRANDLEGTVSVEDMTDMITQVADVMSYLARSGIVHRDICARFG